ncbi:MAG: ATP-dependent DNA helicase RecG [Candidatus Brennerbacteria bacterium]|nr:ATP-dependent DNA helicase RecG [Candidatus Brennerbacteria bacterium]
MKLETSLIQINGIPPRFLLKLKKLGLESVKDLLWHFPFRYEDFSQIYKIAELQPNQQTTVQGIVKEVAMRRSWRRNMFIVEALIEDDTGAVKAVWFNQPYVKNALRPGRLANFSGKVVYSEEDICLSNPAYEFIGAGQMETKHTGRLVPIYPETKGLTSKGIRFLVKPLLENLERLKDFLPASTLKSLDLPEINLALARIHFPEIIEEAESSRKRFAFQDLFLMQLAHLREKQKLSSQKAQAVKINLEDLKIQLKQLPFELTSSQKISLWEILKDMEKFKPMSRLLEGDVGSGKTVVAALAAIQTALNDCQSAFLAPTEVLASQHYKTIKNLFPDFEGGIALLTSSQSRAYYGHNLESEIKKTSLLKEIAAGKIKIIIGTHAIIQKNVKFHNLAFVIVDEQHRFGVEQRAALANPEFKNLLIPHVLSMSATPIPRTLAMTIFGDLDISIINEMPKGRKEIITKIVAPENRDQAYAFIRGQVKKGRQVFVICPRIEQTTDSGLLAIDALRQLEVKNVKTEYEKLSQRIFPDLKVAMLHGKMRPKEKEKIMSDFQNRSSDILVSTSVIEVGVDVPNAAIMMIESSDRFGLASLYQFRGRVGRGEHQSFCFLFTDSSSASTHKRLKAMIEAKNGFELAEKDLEIRGPGEILGKAQSGIPDLAMNSLKDFTLVKTARAEAEKIINNDPALKKYPVLKTEIARFKTKYLLS